MAQPVGLEGANKVFRAPSGMQNCSDLEVFQNEDSIISCWRLTEAEKQEISRSGVVWLSISGRSTPPALVSGEALVIIDGVPSRPEPILPKAISGGKIKI